MHCHLFLFLQAELTFCTGDIITVFGEIDEDGFYYVSWLLFVHVKLLQTVRAIFTSVNYQMTAGGELRSQFQLVVLWE